MDNSYKKNAAEVTPSNPPLKNPLFGFSPWLLVCLSTILALAIIVMALWNTEREREHITRNFLDRADALIWALEAGTRTGIELGEAPKILQPFVAEIAHQRGIAYIAIIDDNGRILAHSNPSEVGKLVPKAELPSTEPPKTIAWNTSHSENSDVYEVYREFAPAPGYHHGIKGEHVNGHRHGGRNSGGAFAVQEDRTPRSFALIGFDKKPYEEMLDKDRLSNLLTALVAAALGLGSFFSLFWAHSYQRSRRLLQDTRALASEVVTCLPVGLITCEPDGRIGMINEAALAMLHMDRSQAMGVPIQDIPGLSHIAATDATARNQKVIEREMELAVNGESRTVSLSASPIRNEDGLFLGHLFILRDISEMKRLQAEARRNDKLRALGSLAAGVAHEIRNPLSSIKGLATYLASKMKPSTPEEEAAKAMIAEVDRLNRVVSQLLEFAKPSAIKLAAANINEVVVRALRLADTDIQAKKIQVAFNAAKDLTPIPLNAERLTQALLNLFLNAIQSMEPGGNLAVDIGLAEAANTCRISVKDDGKGMSPEVQASIFTPYFTTKSSGTGLGLAIVHQIIEGHGGTISVKSAPGAGSVFTLLIPLGYTKCSL